MGSTSRSVGERLDRLDEAAAICRGLLDGETVSRAGRWWSADGAVNDPPPVQARLPLLIGGSGERRTIPIVARYADAWSADGGSPDEISRKAAILDMRAREVGRDPASIRRTAGAAPVLIRDDPAEARIVLSAVLQRHGLSPNEADSVAAADPFVGSPDTVMAALRAYHEAGVEELMFDWPAPFDEETLVVLGGPIRASLTA